MLTIFYDVLGYTVPKTQRVLVDIWFDLMSLSTLYLVHGLSELTVIKSTQLKYCNFFHCVGRRVKSKILVLSADLNNSSCHR